MNEMYAEAGVKKQKSAKDALIKAAIFVADAILLFSGLLGASLLLFLGIAAIVATVYFLPYLSVDYEYIFCDGQFDFDKIMGGNKRKTQLKLDLDNCEVLCPADSHQLDGYTYQRLQVKDFSSGNRDAKTYALVGKDSKNNTMVKVIFEPNEKMLAFAKQKAPRKVFMD